MSAFGVTRQLKGDALSRPIFAALEMVGLLSAELGCPAFVSGGLVRDWILSIPCEDIDIVLEGDAIGFADEFNRRFGCKVTRHRQFGTATVVMKPESIFGRKDFHMDFAQTRRESYPTPAVLPVVEPCLSIDTDLLRRDFTINALAVDLHKDRFGRLVDSSGMGYSDIQERLIRVLHPLSFRDDPTRILRAIRFEQRLEWTIEHHTYRLIGDALNNGYLELTSGPRILTEIDKLCQEDAFPRSFQRMLDTGVWAKLFPGVVGSESGQLPQELFQPLLNRIKSILDFQYRLKGSSNLCRWRVVLGSLGVHLSPENFTQMMTRLHLQHKLNVWTEFTQMREQFATFQQSLRDLSPDSPTYNSSLHHLLQYLSPESRLILLVALNRPSDPDLNPHLVHFLTQLRSRSCSLTGKALQSAGFQRGPLVGKIIAAFFDAELDGQISPDATQQEKLNFINTVLIPRIESSV